MMRLFRTPFGMYLKKNQTVRQRELDIASQVIEVVLHICGAVINTRMMSLSEACPWPAPGAPQWSLVSAIWW
jgi:hypothetical protein